MPARYAFCQHDIHPDIVDKRRKKVATLSSVVNIIQLLNELSVSNKNPAISYE
jgi:hypothetical protein